MPFVLLSISDKLSRSITTEALDEALDMISVAITDIMPGNLDPRDDIDIDIVVRHPQARSKYDMTVFIEAKHTYEREQLIEEDLTDAICRRINFGFRDALMVNVWLKVVVAGYAHS